MNTFDPSNGAYPAAPQWGPDTGPMGGGPGVTQGPAGPESAPTQVGQWAPPVPGQQAHAMPIAPQPAVPSAPEAAPTQVGHWPGSSLRWGASAGPGQNWTNPNPGSAPQQPWDPTVTGNLTAGGQYTEMAPVQPHPGAPNFGPGTQPFGSPPPGDNSPGGPGKLLAVGAAAMAVVAVGVGVVAVTVSGSDEASASDGSTPSMVSALTTGESPSKAPRSTSARPRTSEPTRAAEIGSIVPGYQPVAVPNRSAAYDVPAGWRVAPEGNVGGFGQPPEAVVGTGLATDGVDYCPGSTRTVAFLTGSDTTDPAKAATDTGTKAATIAYTGSRDVKPGAAQPLTSADGSQQGMLVETTGRLDSAKPGCAAQFSVYTYAVPARTGTIVLVLAADTGVPDAVDPATAKRILSSIRPLKR